MQNAGRNGDASIFAEDRLLTHYVLFVISLADRVVHVVGITTRPDEAWMLQVCRGLLDVESGALASKRYLIVDRDTKYTEQFRRLMDEGGLRSSGCRRCRRT